MDDYDFLRENWRKGYKAQPGHHPAAYRCSLGNLRGSAPVYDFYDHDLYLAVDKAIDALPLILRRYFVITTVGRIVLRWNRKKQQDEHVPLTDVEVYRMIAVPLGMQWRDVEHYIKNGGEKKMRAAIVFGAKQYA